MSADLELLRRAPTAAPAPRGRGGRRLTGAILLLGVLAWGFLLAKPLLFPARKVEAVTVRVLEGGAAGAASVAVEATGWIEPDPFPVRVRPFVDGIVASVDVLEGEAVRAGVTVLARLRSAALESALERARSSLSQKTAQAAEAEAEATRARAVLEQRIELRREQAREDGELALARAEVTQAEADVAQAQSELVLARVELTAQEELERKGGGSAVSKAKAVATVATVEGTLAVRRAQVRRAQAQAASAETRAALAREAVVHPKELEGALAVAEARVAVAKAEQSLAQAELGIAEREFAWLIVTAPVDGVVLWRSAAPGSTVGPSSMPRGGEADAGEGSVVSLYDPQRLQARIDVPLGTVSGVGKDRPVELTVEALPGRTFHGVVLRVQSQADPLKNTLQVKVRLNDPDPLLKPEMLVRARFLSEASKGPVAAAGAAGAPPAGPSRLLVPKRAVRGDAIFVLDPGRGGRARRIPVTTGAADGDWVEVRGAVSATHRVILDAVDDDERVDGGAR